MTPRLVAAQFAPHVSVFSDPENGEHPLTGLWHGQLDDETAIEAFGNLGFRKPREAIERLGALRTSNRYLQLPASNLLLFYCAGRRMHLGLSAMDELSALAARTEAACIGGALSIGEIGSLRRGGYPMFHNASLVAMPWASS